MIKNNVHAGLEVLYDQRNLSIEEKRNIAATSLALELISTAVSKQNSDHKLAEEMNNLDRYVRQIYQALSMDHGQGKF